MNEIKNTIWNKRIPPFIGILFLIFSTFTIGWLSGNAILFGTKAAVDNTPKNVQITNVSDTSFTVLYETETKTTGTVKYGIDTNSNQVAFDDRDITKGSPSEYAVHHLTIKNLKASTKYFFTITSGDKNFSNNDRPYEITTAASPLTEGSTITGKIVLDDGSLPSEAYVYVKADNLQPLSGLVDTGGKYQINISSIDPDSILTLEISDSVRRSKILVLASQSSTVPLIILSKDYNFTISNEPLSPTPIASISGTITPISFPKNNGETSASPRILTPEENQEFKDQQPLFRGTAVPNAEVEIIIESEGQITTTVKSSPNGNWQYRPDTKLTPGTHTITIRTTDASGIVRTITQSFVVFAEGGQFTEPSISPVVSPTTQPTVTPTTIITPTTKTVTPTLAVTTFPTTSITSPPIPTTGSMSLWFTVVGIISTVAIGALLFFLTAL